jgi:hypothetical protein
MSNDSLKNREIYIEMNRIGQIVKVTAMDTASLTEAVTQGPASAGEKALKDAALKKLEFVMRKKGLIS